MMENNLYQKIEELIDRQWEIKEELCYSRFDSEKKNECEKMKEEYRHNEQVLHSILSEYFISPLKIADIISKQDKKQYVLKIFRETDQNHVGDTYYTSRFIACYLNDENKFFNYKGEGVTRKSLTGIKTEKYTNYSLPSDQYEELLNSLSEDNSYILSTSDQLTFIPTLSPSAYLEAVNFIYLFIHGQVNGIVTRGFQRTIKEYVKNYLETIDANEVLKENSENEPNE